MKRITVGATLPLACAVLAALAACARAQTLGISPAFVDAQVKSGTTYTKEYAITNNTAERLRVRCSVADVWYDEHNARVDGRAGTLPRSASPWVQFSPAEAVVEPHGTAVVKAIITVPQQASGGFYTVPVYDIESADRAGAQAGTASAGVAINFRGLLMLTTIGSTEYGVEIMGGHVEPPGASRPMELKLDVRNRGTAHVNLRGQFALLGASGRFAGRGRVDAQRLMPGQRNTVNATWAGELAPGSYTAVVTLSYDRAGADAATLVYELPFDVK